MKLKLAHLAVICAFAVPGLASSAQDAAKTDDAASQKCAATITGNDAMQFDLKEMTADKSCTEFKLTLKHIGKLPANAMGHNWVLTKESDMQGAANDGVKAGLDNDYVKPDDERV